METGGSAGAGGAGGKLKEVQEEGESSSSAAAPPVEVERMVDGKRIKELPFEYMQAPEEDLVILIGQSFSFSPFPRPLACFPSLPPVTSLLLPSETDPLSPLPSRL